MKNIVLIAFMLACTGMLRAQNTTFELRFDHFALSVKDADRSAEFYTKLLKLTEITNRTKMAGIRWMSLGEGKELHLISILPGQVIVTKAVHLGLTTTKFDDVKKSLEDAKITYSDWPGTVGTFTKRADGVRQMYFQDPDGYWIEINDATAQTTSLPRTDAKPQ